MSLSKWQRMKPARVVSIAVSRMQGMTVPALRRNVPFPDLTAWTCTTSVAIMLAPTVPFGAIWRPPTAPAGACAGFGCPWVLIAITGERNPTSSSGGLGFAVCNGFAATGGGATGVGSAATAILVLAGGGGGS